LKGDPEAARRPRPVRIAVGAISAAASAVRQRGPSVTTRLAGARCPAASRAISVSRKPLTGSSVIWRGRRAGLVETAATNGVLPAAPRPRRRRRLLAAEPAPELERADPVLGMRDQPDGEKPGRQRQLGRMDDRAGEQRHLAPAAPALRRRPGAQLGAFTAATGRADEPIDSRAVDPVPQGSGPPWRP
jgi:hypothetical protein